MPRPFLYTFSKLIAATLLCTMSAFSDAEQLFIGLDADVSGNSKIGGIAIKRGAQIAIDEINASGGIKGKQLSLLVRDHKGNPARGLSNLKKFSNQENLIAVLGGVHTPVILQELELIHSNELLYLVPWAAGTPVTDNNYSPNYVFRASLRDSDAGAVLVNHAVKNGATKLSLVLERTGWGRSNEASMKRAAQAQGVDIVGIHWVNWGTQDLKEEVAVIKSEMADTIMLVANVPEAVALLKAVVSNEELSEMPIVSHWGVAGGNFVSELGLNNLNKLNLTTIQTFSFVRAYNKERAQSFLKAYRDKYDPSADEKNIPGVVGLAQAYDLVKMLSIAANNSNSLTMPDLRDSFEKITKYDGLMRQYDTPFANGKNEALTPEDYFMARFDETGNIVPLQPLLK